MYQKLLDNIENYAKENNLDLEQAKQQAKLEKKQNSFLKTNIGQAINGALDIGLKIVLPDCIEDEVISVKESLVTEGFSAAVDTAIEEATNLGKSAMGILTGTFENISQIKKAIEKGGLIETMSDLLDTAINWGKEHGYIKKGIASTLKKGKNTVMKTIKNGVDNTLENQVEAVEKIEGYISKWQKYYEEKNFPNMEYQYKKIEENLQEIIPLEKILKKARTIENLHKLIKNNSNKEDRFKLTEQEKELAEMLVN